MNQNLTYDDIIEKSRKTGYEVRYTLIRPRIGKQYRDKMAFLLFLLSIIAGFIAHNLLPEVSTWGIFGMDILLITFVIGFFAHQINTCRDIGYLDFTADEIIFRDPDKNVTEKHFLSDLQDVHLEIGFTGSPGSPYYIGNDDVNLVYALVVRMYFKEGYTRIFEAACESFYSARFPRLRRMIALLEQKMEADTPKVDIVDIEDTEEQREIQPESISEQLRRLNETDHFE